MKSTSITIIIPTYTNIKGLKKLLAFLQSLDYPIIVIDNQPLKEKNFLSKMKHVSYLPQEKNRGFADAVNYGASFSQSDWLAILNDDIDIKDEKLFEKLLKFALKKNYAAVSPVLKKSNGEIENLGYQVLPIGRVDLIKDVSRYTLHVTRGELDGLTAACLLIKKKAFESIGGFDQRFFAYLEDVDLFLRLKKTGQKFSLCLEAEVIHQHMTTSSKMGNFKQKQDFKNWLLLIGKNWDKKTILRYGLGILSERLRNLSGLIKATLSTL